MPAEWEPHEATWLSWPKDPATFPPEIIDKVEAIYLKMIEELARGERVDLLVEDRETQDKVSSLLKSTRNVVFHHVHTVDVWIRDYGPIFVKNSEVAATKWRFNAWGNKYDDLKEDEYNGMQVARLSSKKIFETNMVLEGGSIDVNGSGICLTTKQCLLNGNRNPKMSASEIESTLRDYLGVRNLIWLDSGISGDDTDGHVDDIARFVGPRTVICMSEKDQNDENHATLSENLASLRGARDQDGSELEVIILQMPGKVEAPDGRLPASYANFYIANAAVLVPIFDDQNDEHVIETLQRYFPDRRIVGIDCRPLVYGFGGIHCVTQQQPLA